MPEIVVLGKPQPKGSTRAFVMDGRAVTTSSNPNLREWERAIANEARRTCAGWFSTAALAVDIQFFFARPASVSEEKRPHPTVKPDLDKLVRGALDALSGVLWKDDTQIVSIRAEKFYADQAYMVLSVEELQPF